MIYKNQFFGGMDQDDNLFVKKGKYTQSILITISVFDQRLKLPYVHVSLVTDVKKWIKLQIANCAPEGRLFEAVLWSNTGLFYFTSLFMSHFFF